jgi:8-oxo-dGTP pyrophosphatase MutT (NUDIX family)
VRASLLALDTIAALEAHAAAHPAQAATARAMIAFARSVEDPFARTTRPGHFTGSAIVLDASGRRALLVRHRFLGRWLQPGGHVDPGESPAEAALREAREETGLSSIRPWPGREGALVDIDSHPIPANPRKGEGPHVHHDLRFAFLADAAETARAAADEASDVRWFPLAEAAAEAWRADILPKLRALPPP